MTDPHDQDYLPASEDGFQEASPQPSESSSRELAAREDHAAVVFNPLDADSGNFARMVQQRQRNYATLREHLLASLVRGKDFARLHVIKDCPDKYNCTFEQRPYHFSGWQLLSPGADKILGILGLAPTYPGAEDYRKSVLAGVELQHIIMRCCVVDANGRTISEGTGTASVSEHRNDLHNAMLKAQKRARLEAVKRLPTVSALFETTEFVTADDLHDVDRQRQRDDARRSQADPVAPRPRQSRYATGRALERMPFGEHKGVPFSQIDGKYLQWVTTLTDKPDVSAAAKVELDRRALMEPELRPDAPADSDRPTFDDDGPPIDSYFD